MIKIKCSHAQFGVNKEEFDFPSGCIDIISEDGRALFTIFSTKGGASIEISGAHTSKVGNKVYGMTLSIEPVATNRVRLLKKEL